MHGSQGTRGGDAFGGISAEQRMQHTQELHRHHADRELPRDGGLITASWLIQEQIKKMYKGRCAQVKEWETVGYSTKSCNELTRL